MQDANDGTLTWISFQPSLNSGTQEGGKQNLMQCSTASFQHLFVKLTDSRRHT